MTMQFDQSAFIALLSVLAVTGCSQPTAKDQVEATEKVLREVGVTTGAQKSAEVQEVTEAQEPLAPSIVKQDGKNQSKESNATIASKSAPASKSPSRQKISNDDPIKKWTTAEKLPRDVWEVQYLGNAQVGFSHRTVTPLATLPNHSRIELDSRIRVALNGKPQEQRIRILTIEKENGEVLRIEGSFEIGSRKQTFEGTVNQEMLKLKGNDNGQDFAINLAWKNDFRGPFAVEQSMIRNPMRPGELRKLKYFDPLRRKMIDGVLDAKEYISTPIVGVTQELLEVRSIGTIGENGSQSLLWVDRNGECLKTFVQEFDILSFRSEAIAGQIFEACTNLRAFSSISIPLGGDVERLTAKPNKIESVTYRFSHKTEDAFRMITDKIGQLVKTVDQKTVDVTVFLNGRAVDSILESNPTVAISETLAASDFVPKDSLAIKKLGKGLIAADTSLSEESSNTDKAKTCQREIQKRVSLKDFDDQIRPIQQVLKSKSAHCVEHALLLASVCRSIDVPTRIAIGIKCNRSKAEPAMQFHTWVEILDGSRWVPMDSCDVGFPSSIDRIKIRDSNFNSANPYLDILTVCEFLPGLAVQVRPL